jgi:hypothetical protein
MEITQRKGEVMGKGSKRVNMVQKYIQVYVNAKMIPVETIPGISGGEIKENGGGSEFKYDIYDTVQEPL